MKSSGHQPEKIIMNYTNNTSNKNIKFLSFKNVHFIQVEDFRIQVFYWQIHLFSFLGLEVVLQLLFRSIHLSQYYKSFSLPSTSSPPLSPISSPLKWLKNVYALAHSPLLLNCVCQTYEREMKMDYRSRRSQYLLGFLQKVMHQVKTPLLQPKKYYKLKLTSKQATWH